MKSSKMRLIPLLVGLALVAGMVPAAMAGTSAPSVDGTVVLNHSVKSMVDIRYVAKKKKFTGDIDYVQNEVSPDELGCTEERKVTLFKVTRRGAVKIDAKTIDYFYNFTLSRPASGTYLVKVAPRTFSDRYGDLIECSGAKASKKV